MCIHSNVLVFLFATIVSAAPPTVGAGITSETPNVKAVNTENPDILIIGASYAKDWPVQALAGRPVVNRGIGGQESHEVLARFEKDVVAHRPSTVIIWGFINDIFRSSPEALPAKKKAIKDNISQMVDLARRNGIRPIVATEVTMRPEGSIRNAIMGWIGKLMGKRGYAEKINEHVQQVNDWLRQYASANNILLLDLQSILSEPSGLRKKEYAKEDGSHITPSAYAALTKYAETELSRLLGAAR